MKQYSFEDVKNYFQKEESQAFTEMLKSGVSMELKEFISLAIEDLERLASEEAMEPRLFTNDLKGAELISFKLIYHLVSDKYAETKEYAEHWACLLKNYVLNFYPDFYESVEGLINLLALQNNMARLISLSDYLSFKKETEYKMVPKSFLESFMNE